MVLAPSKVYLVCQVYPDCRGFCLGILAESGGISLGQAFPSVKDWTRLGPGRRRLAGKVLLQESRVELRSSPVEGPPKSKCFPPVWMPRGGWQRGPTCGRDPQTQKSSNFTRAHKFKLYPLWATVAFGPFPHLRPSAYVTSRHLLIAL